MYFDFGLNKKTLSTWLIVKILIKRVVAYIIYTWLWGCEPNLSGKLNRLTSELCRFNLIVDKFSYSNSWSYRQLLRLMHCIWNQGTYVYWSLLSLPWWLREIWYVCKKMHHLVLTSCEYPFPIFIHECMILAIYGCIFDMQYLTLKSTCSGSQILEAF